MAKKKSEGETVHTVCGLGEVGSAIVSVLRRNPNNRVIGVDPGKGLTKMPPPQETHFLHIAFPFSKDFKGEADIAIAYLDPEIVIVHSTVPVGTTASLYGGDAVHSPVEGQHPGLAESLLVFPKHFGGAKARDAAKPFQDLGVTVRLHNQAKTTELAKLLATSWFGCALLIAREQAQICRQAGVSYSEAVQSYTRDYNASYGVLDHPEYTRPILSPPQGPLGGHCVAPNAKLLPTTPPIHQMLVDYNG